MDYGPFLEEFPEVAKEETRQINVVNQGGKLPKGRYLLIELFCTDPECDCRRVFFNVKHVESDQLVAVIAYGWEDDQYYHEWFGMGTPEMDMSEVITPEMNMPEMIEILKGPALNPTSPQTEVAPAVLEEVETVLEDEEYVERIMRHYEMFKESIAPTDRN